MPSASADEREHTAASTCSALQRLPRPLRGADGRISASMPRLSTRSHVRPSATHRTRYSSAETRYLMKSNDPIADNQHHQHRIAPSRGSALFGYWLTTPDSTGRACACTEISHRIIAISIRTRRLCHPSAPAMHTLLRRSFNAHSVELTAAV